MDCFEDIDKRRLPDHYMCERCKPRPFNAARARLLQQKKLKLMIAKTEYVAFRLVSHHSGCSAVYTDLLLRPHVHTERVFVFPLGTRIKKIRCAC